MKYKKTKNISAKEYDKVINDIIAKGERENWGFPRILNKMLNESSKYNLSEHTGEVVKPIKCIKKRDK